MEDKICGEVAIREATNKDSGFIRDLIFEIWINEYHFDVNRQNFPDLNDIEKYYTKESGIFLVSVVNNKIIGTIACNKLSHEQFILKRMFVDKDYRGLGIAQMLLDNLFKLIVREDSNISFFLSTKESDAVVAKKFYLKNGFRIISKSALPKNFQFFYKDDLFMLKDSGFASKI